MSSSRTDQLQTDQSTQPAKALSPANRRDARERAEAAALAELDAAARRRCEQSARLRRLRLADKGKKSA